MRSKWIEDQFDIELRPHQKRALDTPGDLGLRWGRRTGKTLTLSLAAIHDAFNGGQVAVGAPTKAQLGLINDAVLELFEDANIAVLHSSRDRIAIEEGIIMFFLLGQDIRGKPADTMLLEEADYVDGWMDAFVPLSDSIIAASTPDPMARHKDFRRWCDNNRVTEIVSPTSDSPYWTASTEEEFKSMYEPGLYRVEILAEWPDHSGIKDLPKKVQLYWKCECCQEEHLYPQERARKYCDDACKQAAYRMRKNSNR